MGQIIKSPASIIIIIIIIFISDNLQSVCLSVCLSVSYGRNSHSVLMKLCTEVWNPKSKIVEFVGDQNPTNDSPIFPQFLLLARYVPNVAKRSI